MAEVPSDFQLFETGSPFNALVGPYYWKRIENEVIFGLLIEKQHCNTSGRLHGAMICAVADIALGHNVWLALAAQGATRVEGANGAVMSTVSLSTDFTGTAREGDWVEIHADVHKTGKSLVFANAYMIADDSRIARVSGVYKIIEKQLRSTEGA